VWSLVAGADFLLLFQCMWVYNHQKEKMERRDIKFVPGLYKIFDEILGVFCQAHPSPLLRRLSFSADGLGAFILVNACRQQAA